MAPGSLAAPPLSGCLAENRAAGHISLSVSLMRPRLHLTLPLRSQQRHCRRWRREERMLGNKRWKLNNRSNTSSSNPPVDSEEISSKCDIQHLVIFHHSNRNLWKWRTLYSALHNPALYSDADGVLGNGWKKNNAYCIFTRKYNWHLIYLLASPMCQLSPKLWHDGQSSRKAKT